MRNRAAQVLVIAVVAPLVVGLAVFVGMRLARAAELAERGGHDHGGREYIETDAGRSRLQEPLLHGFAEKIDPPQPASDFTLEDESGLEVTLSDHAEDGIVVLGFWLTRCIHGCPINAYMVAQLQQALEEERPQVASDVTYLAVSIDPEHDTPEERRRFVNDYVTRFGGTVRFLGGEREELEPIWGDYRVHVETRSTALELERLGMTEQQLLQRNELDMQSGHHAALPDEVKQGVIDAVNRAVVDDHLVVHSDMIYLIKDGRLRYRLLGHDIDAAIVADKIASLAGRE